MTANKIELQTIAPDGRPPEDQPAWRQDFPIDVTQDQYVARRDFTKFLVFTSLAFVVGQFWIIVQNWFRQRQGRPPRQRIARLDDIPVGGTVMFHYPTESEPCILVRPDTSTLLAYNQKCTHLSCAVVPEVDKERIHCPCHHGHFDLATGRPLAGPPRRPLTQIVLEKQGGVVYATGIELRAV